MRLLSGVQGVLTAVFVVSLFTNLLLFAVPLYMLQIYDRVLISRSQETLLLLTLVVLGLLLVLALLEWLRAQVLARCGEWLDQTYQRGIIRRTLDREAPASLLGEARRLRDFFSTPAAAALFDVPLAPLFLLGVYILHPQLGLVATAGLVGLLAIGITGEFLTRHPVRRASELFAEVDRLAHSVARNAEALRVMGMAPAFTERWSRLQAEGLGAQVAGAERAAALNASAKGWRLVVQVAMLGWGAWLAVQQEITAGVIIAASIIGGRALAPAETLVSNWRNVLGARGAYDALQKYLAPADRENAAEDAGQERLRMPEVQGALDVEALVAGYGPQSPPVLKGVSFHLKPGEILGVTGPSGSGKSTLVRCLVGLLPPASGAVRVDGFELDSWNRQHLAEHMGFLPQTVQLFEGRLDANIARFGEVDDAAVVRAARHAGAHEVVARFPDGYNTVLDANGSPLSGGELQRVALARATYGEPELIVLDEPTSNLDGEGESAFKRFLEYAREAGSTVVIVAHRPNVLIATDKMLVLQEGQVTEFGPTQEVLARIVRRAVPEGLQGAVAQGEAQAVAAAGHSAAPPPPAGLKSGSTAGSPPSGAESPTGSGGGQPPATPPPAATGPQVGVGAQGAGRGSSSRTRRHSIERAFTRNPNDSET